MTTTIGFPIPTTSRGCNWTSVKDSHLFKLMLPNFFATYTPEYNYKFYIGIDDDDPLYSQPEQQELIKKVFSRYPNMTVSIVSMSGIPKGHLTKMWNRLLKMAYEEGCDYFYICGDDIIVETPGWMKKAVEILKEHNNIGITGPMSCNGNTNIITQTFISRLHWKLFGCAFPEEIKNWYCDDWINLIYRPEYVYLMPEYKSYNLGGKERYDIVRGQGILNYLVKRDRATLENYLKVL